MDFKGIFGATVLPLDDEGEEINFADLERVFQSQKDGGISGVVCNAHAGQGELLSHQEKVQVLRTARRVLGEGYPIVAGIQAAGTRDLLAQARDAVEAGAGALMLCAPPLFAWHADRHPEFGFAQIEAVAAELPETPLVLFQYSPHNPYYYTPRSLVEICERVPQVEAIKVATSVDVMQFEEEVRTVRTLGRHVAVLPATGRTFLYTFQLRPDGALSGSANFLPEHDVELYNAVMDGDLARAKRLHDDIYPVFSLVYRQPFVNLHIRYVYCTWLMGKISSPALRSPLQPLTKDEADALRAALIASGCEVVR